ncbi:hypothetical protein CBL_09946 [Carabus blaptoides fortunei]
MAMEAEIQNGLRNKQHTIVILFDVEKAYDTTWKYKIIKLLQENGIQGNMLYYINNFMTNRKFKVKTNGCVSDEMTQDNGVPQGEVLSPPLFLLAINNITASIPKHTKVSLFADDLAISHVIMIHHRRTRDYRRQCAKVFGLCCPLDSLHPYIRLFIHLFDLYPHQTGTTS